MKKIFRLSLMLVLLMMLFGCGKSDDEKEDKSTDSTKKSPGMSSVSASDMDEEAKKKLVENGAIRENQVKLKGNGEDTVTVMIYMNGSNLETDDGEATIDLTEMVNAGSSDKVNVVVQTMATQKWDSKYGIASDRSQIYSIDKDGLKLVKDDLGQLDCTKSETLTDFIKWSASTYPAGRYILLFWDHGGGPVFGFGYDDTGKNSEETMSMAEMRKGIADAGVFFDFVGMDCCIMASLEVGCALYDYCDYTVLSEDFESGLGWDYTSWLKKLYNNPSISTVDLGKDICDSMVEANEKEAGGDKSIMAVVDESMIKVLYTAWTDFAYANKSELLNTNYSKKVKRKAGGRKHPVLDSYRFFNNWDYDNSEDNPDMADYYVTDIMAVAQNINSDESEALAAALKQALVYVSSSSGETGLTGLSVTLPYGDSDFYKDLKEVFSGIGIDDTYIAWLEEFTGVKTSNTSSYDYDDWYEDWDWDEYTDDFDWNDWNYIDDDEYWEDDCDWDDWDYNDSYNYWFEENYGDDYEDFWNWDDDDWEDDDHDYDDHDYDDWDDDDYHDHDYDDYYFWDNYYQDDDGWEY